MIRIVKTIAVALFIATLLLPVPCQAQETRYGLQINKSEASDGYTLFGPRGGQNHLFNR